MVKEAVSSISKAKNYAEIAEFWDTHSVADYADQVKKVDMTFDPSARLTSVRLEPELFLKLRRIAQEKRISLETLVNLWLSQHIRELKAIPV